MIVFSIVAYIIFAIWYLLGKSTSQKASMIIAVLLSSFYAFWYWEIDNLTMIIYLVMGLISIFFYWIAFDNSTIACSSKKNKISAGILALFLGGIGIHKFYLKRNASGLFYILLCWTSLPSILGVIEAFVFFFMKKENFNKKYNEAVCEKRTSKEKRTNRAEKTRQEPQSVKIDFSEFWDDSENDYSKFKNKSENKRDGDNLKYTDIRVCDCQAKALGTVEDFTITVYKNGRTYTFKARDGDICSCRSSEMRSAKRYEVE